MDIRSHYVIYVELCLKLFFIRDNKPNSFAREKYIQCAFIFLCGRKMLKVGRWSSVKYLKSYLSFITIFFLFLEIVICNKWFDYSRKIVQF